MKKIIALALAILMMAAMAVPAFAEEVIKNNETEQDLTSTTVVKFGVDQTYTVTIPAEITISSETLTGAIEVSASNVRIPGGKSLYIAVTSTNGWKLKPSDGNTSNEDVDYTAKVAGINGDAAFGTAAVEFLTVAAGTTAVEGAASLGASGSATINLATAGTGKVGQYSDTLTFGAAIK